jgi:putative spermidine/putrescine transport system substrate-binding protein
MKTIKLMATTALGVLSGLSPALAQITEVGAAEGQVNIVAWPGYIERGETMKEFDWVTKFEAASGCKVNVKTANTSDEMVALMNEAGTHPCAWWPVTASSRSTLI